MVQIIWHYNVEPITDLPNHPVPLPRFNNHVLYSIIELPLLCSPILQNPALILTLSFSTMYPVLTLSMGSMTITILLYSTLNSPCPWDPQQSYSNVHIPVFMELPYPWTYWPYFPAPCTHPVQELSDHPIPVSTLQGAVLAVAHRMELVLNVGLLGDLCHQVWDEASVLGTFLLRIRFLLQ